MAMMGGCGYWCICESSQPARLQVDALAGAAVKPREVFSDVTSGAKNACRADLACGAC